MKYFERIKDMREDHDLKQSDIAKILNIPPQKISQYENGNVMMRIDKYITLAKYYNISLDYLTGIIDTPRPLFEDKTYNMPITTKEAKILEAYRKNKSAQIYIEKILDIN